MTYQAIARKFRPKQFSEVVGQPIIVQALQHALRTGNIHHAYLLTGTRGVGKTTVGRLIAKAINCTQLKAAEPCSECENCQAIDRQCAPDLIEVDGASKTKVEEIRSLLENVQYLPNQGKYRIYLIDEVHMLSIHSFNALLKTLEEPPAHVLFILATTEPHKIPVTIASRCLQLAFRPLSEQELASQLENIVKQENINFEPVALHRLAQASAGSLRDALSLLEQAVGVGLGQVTEQAVSQMLGITTRDNQLEILESIVHQKTDFLFEFIQNLSNQSIDFKQLLNSLMELLHEIALKQVINNISLESNSVSERILKLSKIISPEQVQVFYQIVLEGQKNLSYMPGPQKGFEMICLRLLAFQPLELGEQFVIPEPRPAGSVDSKSDTRLLPAKTSSKTNPESIIQQVVPTPSDPSENFNSNIPAKPSVQSLDKISTHIPVNNQWLNILPHLKLTGLAQVIARQCVIGKGSIEQGTLQLLLSAGHRLLLNPVQIQKIEAAVSEYAGQTVQVSIDIASSERSEYSEKKIMPESIPQPEPVRADAKIHAVMQHPTGQAIVQSLQAKLVRVSDYHSEPITETEPNKM